MTAPRPVTLDQIATVDDLRRVEAKLDALRDMLERVEIAPAPQWLTVSEAARRYEVDPSTVRRWIAQGRIEVRHGPRGREVKV